jgi:hypothetical protein
MILAAVFTSRSRGMVMDCCDTSAGNTRVDGKRIHARSTG